MVLTGFGSEAAICALAPPTHAGTIDLLAAEVMNSSVHHHPFRSPAHSGVL
jgi:hypothetical protein